MSVRAPEREQLMESAAPAQPAVEVTGLAQEFPGRRGKVAALEDLSLQAAAGEVLGLVGPSGCGKSTLLEIVAGLQEPTAGVVSVEGRTAASARLAGCVLMPQRDLLLPWRTALDNAGLALELRGTGRRQARRRATELFRRFGLEEFSSARPDELSGGMRQRVAFARTLLAERPVLLLDEPFASLDAITRAELQEWTAAQLGTDRRTVLLVTHDIEEALYLCDRVLVLSRRPGRVRAQLPGFRRAGRPRADVVTAVDFSSLRQEAMRALA